MLKKIALLGVMMGLASAPAYAYLVDEHPFAPVHYGHHHRYTDDRDAYYWERGGARMQDQHYGWPRDRR